MTLSIIILVFISALLHTAWNILGKKNVPSVAFFFIASLASVFVLLPLLLISGFDFSIYWQCWIYLAASGFCQAVYYTGLAGAYETGELSLAYPLARAFPVLLVPFISFLTGHTEGLSIHALIGMAIIFSGCLILPIQNWHTITIKTYIQRYLIFALLAAVATSAYTVIDSAGMKILNSILTPSVSQNSIIYMFIPGITNTNQIFLDTILKAIYYFTIQMVYVVFYYGIYFLFNQKERLKLAKVIRNEKLPACTAGLMVAAAYIIILIVYPLASNVSYITALRQVSIPLGAVAGIVFLKEKRYGLKITGVFLIFSGLIMVSL